MKGSGRFKAWTCVLAATSLWCAVREAEAHPVLVDRIEGTVGATTLDLRVRTTLRTPLVAMGIGRGEGLTVSPARALQSVNDAAAYVASHVTVRALGLPLVARVLGASMPDASDAAAVTLDVEGTHVLYTLSYELPEAAWNTEVVLETNMLDEFEAAPLQPWEQTFAVTLSADASHTVSGVLRAGKPLSMRLPRAEAATVGTRAWVRFAPKLMALGLVGYLTFFGVRRAARRWSRR